MPVIAASQEETCDDVGFNSPSAILFASIPEDEMAMSEEICTRGYRSLSKGRQLRRDRKGDEKRRADLEALLSCFKNLEGLTKIVESIGNGFKQEVDDCTPEQFTTLREKVSKFPWVRKESRSKAGIFYFFNQKTGETVLDEYSVQEQREEVSEHDVSFPWVRKESKSKAGKFYFFNLETGETLWTFHKKMCMRISEEAPFRLPPGLELPAGYAWSDVATTDTGGDSCTESDFDYDSDTSATTVLASSS
jgi:hypothetical protein